MRWGEAWVFYAGGEDVTKSRHRDVGGESTCRPSLATRVLSSEPGKKKPNIMAQICNPSTVMAMQKVVARKSLRELWSR